MVSSSERTYGNPQTRKRILDVALQLAAELGPSMKLADVSTRAGVSHQGLYLHFGGRNGLLLALLPHMQEAFDLHSHHQQVIESPDGRTAIGRMVEFLGLLNERLDTIGWVLEEAQHIDKAFGRDWRLRVVGLRKVIETDVIRRLADEGSLGSEWSVTDAADLLLAVTTLGAWREMTRELGWTPQQYTANITRIVETSLLDEQPS